MESTFLNIPDNLRPTYSLNIFIAILSGSDTFLTLVVLILVKKISQDKF